ncbi:hypothetical protein [Streptomyces niveus]|uniref:hypothetical protein n=1 Tax=Streptomyces niveus TaxID=193462 RepID=UPI0033AF1424
MSRYRVQYAPAAQAVLKAMDRGLRNSFEQGSGSWRPIRYGHGSCAVKGEKDRRQAVVARVTIAVYYVSADPGILIAGRTTDPMSSGQSGSDLGRVRDHCCDLVPVIFGRIDGGGRPDSRRHRP